jgi:hypothetical protein
MGEEWTRFSLVACECSAEARELYAWGTRAFARTDRSAWPHFQFVAACVSRGETPSARKAKASEAKRILEDIGKAAEAEGGD